MTPLISPLGTADHDAWHPLWRGYQAFYKVPIPAEATRTTWSRLLDSVEPMHVAIALDDAGRAVGVVHWLTHRSTWTTVTDVLGPRCASRPWIGVGAGCGPGRPVAGC